MDPNSGSYVALYLSERSNTRLKNWANRVLLDISEIEPLYDYHITVCYSVKPIDFNLYTGKEETTPLNPSYSPDKMRVAPHIIQKIIRDYKELQKQ